MAMTAMLPILCPNVRQLEIPVSVTLDNNLIGTVLEVAGCIIAEPGHRDRTPKLAYRIPQATDTDYYTESRPFRTTIPRHYCLRSEVLKHLTEVTLTFGFNVLPNGDDYLDWVTTCMRIPSLTTVRVHCMGRSDDQRWADLATSTVDKFPNIKSLHLLRCSLPMCGVASLIAMCPSLRALKVQWGNHAADQFIGFAEVGRAIASFAPLLSTLGLDAWIHAAMPIPNLLGPRMRQTHWERL